MRARVTIGLGVAAMLVAAVGVAFWYASSGRLAESVRARMISEAERATGGRVEIGRFRFDWHSMTAEIDDAVVHGTEPAGVAPLFSARRVMIRFRVVSFLRRSIDLLGVEVDEPRTHLIVAQDGGTNLPHLKARGRSGIEQILDLRIQEFEAHNGFVKAEVRGRTASQPWNAHGKNLMARINYDASGPRYAGSISFAPLRIAAGSLGAADLTASAEIAIDRDCIRLASADLRTRESSLHLSNLEMRNFEAPVITSHYEAKLNAADFTRARGLVESSGDVRFVSPGEYSLWGVATGQGIEDGSLRVTSVSAKIDAVPDRIVLKDVRAHTREGEILGNAELLKLREFHLRGRLEHFEAAPLIAIAARAKSPYNARLSGPFEASGNIDRAREGRFIASAHVSASPVACAGCVPVHGDIDAKYDGNAQVLSLGQSSVRLPSSSIDFSGVFGRELNVKVTTSDLGDFRPAIGDVRAIQFRGGQGSFAGTVKGSLNDPAVAGHVSVTRAIVNGQNVDSFAGDIAAGKSNFSVTSGALTEGSLKARVSGSVALVNWRPSEQSAIDATAQISGADVKTLLAMADEKNLPVTGTGAADAHVAGTLGDPHMNATVSLARGFIHGQPFDSVTARIQNAAGGAQTFTAAFASGAKRVAANGRFSHAPGTPPFTGTLTFHVQSNPMALNQIALIRARQPDLHGLVQFHGEGAARIARDARGNLTFDLMSLDGDASASGIELEGRNLGDARLTVATKSDVLTAQFDSNAAKASIHGSATVELTHEYPATATITFSRAGLNAFAVLLASPKNSEKLNVDGTAAGEITVHGPLTQWTKLSAEMSMPEIELHPVDTGNCGSESTCAGIRSFHLQNSGPVRLSMANGIVSMEAARFTGPQTDVSVTGTFGFTERSGYNLRAIGDVNLALASSFTTDYTASGLMRVNAAMRGALNSPDLSGRIDIRNAAMRYSGFSNGLSNVNAALEFSGNRATIQSFTGESGGGRVNAGGFVALTGGLVAFRLDTRTTGVRLRFAEGASVVSDSHITIAGTSERSEASGTVTIHRVTVNQRADFSSVFARTAEPVKAPTVQAGLLSRVNLDVQIETAQDVALETSLAQRIQADANLRLRGTATNPALLGRINITSGELMFFGNKYTITTGSISFLNPSRIDPILNIDLETRARGVDVILTIAGPLTKPGVSYRSDPPLQFSDIVALLATGRTPYDPGLPSGTVGQQQAFAQLGASQLIGEAIQNPASGRLQRFFGVSSVKIDPQLTDITGSPESRLTLEQQVSPDILFTYITDVANTSTQLIRVEWAFNRNWSAIVTREENGYVGLDFAYRKRFK